MHHLEFERKHVLFFIWEGFLSTNFTVNTLYILLFLADLRRLHIIEDRVFDESPMYDSLVLAAYQPEKAHADITLMV